MRADVAAVDDEVGAPVHREHGARDEQLHHAAVFDDKVARQLTRGAAFTHLAHKVFALRGVAPNAQLDRRLAHDVGRAVARNALEGVVDHGVAAGGQVGQRDDVGAGGHQVREQRFRTSHGFFGAAAFGVVDVDRKHGRATVGFDHHAGGTHGDAPTLAAAQAEVGHWQRFADGHGGELFEATAAAFARVAVFKTFQQVAPEHGLELTVAEELHGCRVGVDDQPSAMQQQWRGDAREEFEVAGLCGRQRLACLHMRGDLARHAPVAAKQASAVKTRLTAHTEVARVAAARTPAHAQFTKRHACFKIGLQGVKRFGVAAELRHLPGHMAQHVRRPTHRRVLTAVVDGDHTQLRVELPVGVGGDAQQPGETALALVGRRRMARQHARDGPATGQPHEDHRELGPQGW